MAFLHEIPLHTLISTLKCYCYALPNRERRLTGKRIHVATVYQAIYCRKHDVMSWNVASHWLAFGIMFAKSDCFQKVKMWKKKTKKKTCIRMAIPVLKLPFAVVDRQFYDCKSHFRLKFAIVWPTIYLKCSFEYGYPLIRHPANFAVLNPCFGWETEK